MILDISFHEVITGTLRKRFHGPGSRLGRFPQQRTWQILWQRRFLGFTGRPFLNLTWPSLLPNEWQVSAQVFSTALLCSSPRSHREGISSIRPSKSIDFVEQLEQKKNEQLSNHWFTWWPKFYAINVDQNYDIAKKFSSAYIGSEPKCKFRNFAFTKGQRQSLNLL